MKAIRSRNDGTPRRWRRRGVRGMQIALALAVLAFAGAAMNAHQSALAGGGEDEGGTHGGAPPSSIWVIPADGSAQPARVTQGSGYDVWADSAPSGGRDGGRIAFSSTRSGAHGSTGAEIYTMNADGSGLTQETDSAVPLPGGGTPPTNAQNPALSPDGARIAFDATSPTTGGLAPTQVWVLDTTKPADDPSRLVQVTHSPATEGQSADPSWSPDGTKLALTRGQSQPAHIVVLDVATMKETPITSERDFNRPSWSPTDPNLLVVTMGDKERADVYSIDLSGGLDNPVLRALAWTENVSEASPAISPDGTKVAYQRGDQAWGSEIWVMNIGGGDKHAVATPTAGSDRRPSWSAAGSQIFFESTQGAEPTTDLGLSMIGEPTSAAIGEQVTFTISVVNAGPLAASDAKVVDTLPAGLAYVSASAELVAAESEGHGGMSGGSDTGESGGMSGGSDTGGTDGGSAGGGTVVEPTVSVEGNVVTAQLGQLATSKDGAAVARIVVVAEARQKGTQSNSAVVSHGARDSAPANDTAEVVVEVRDPSSGGGSSTPGSTGGGAQVASGAGQGASPAADPQLGKALVPGGKPCTVVERGSGGTVSGTPGNDVVCVLGEGQHAVYTGDGNDTIYTGSGKTTVYAGDGNDTVIGGSGADIVHGGAGNDVLVGGAGNDVLNGAAGNDVVYGGAGNDILLAGVGTDRLYGGAGNDRLVTRHGARGDWANGGKGTDTARIDRGDGLYSVETRF